MGEEAFQTAEPRVEAGHLQTVVYLAGASREAARVGAIAKRLEASGMVVLAFDWWSTAPKWSGRDASYPRDDQAKYARAEIAAIRECSLFWLLYPDTQSVGCHVELGFALAERKHVVVSGARSSESTFTSLASFRDACDEVGMFEVIRFALAARLEHWASAVKP